MPPFSRNHMFSVDFWDLSGTRWIRLIRLMLNISRIKVFLILQITGKVLFMLIHLKIKKSWEFLKENTVFKGENRFVWPDRYRRMYLSFYSFQGYLKKIDNRFGLRSSRCTKKNTFNQNPWPWPTLCITFNRLAIPRNDGNIEREDKLWKTKKNL